MSLMSALSALDPLSRPLSFMHSTLPSVSWPSNPQYIRLAQPGIPFTRCCLFVLFFFSLFVPADV